MTKTYTVFTSGAPNTLCAIEAAHRFVPIGEPYQGKDDKGLIYPSRHQVLCCQRCGETIEVISGLEMLVDD